MSDELMVELLRVHDVLARRENASSMLIGQSALLDKDYYTAIATALLTLGGTHAPIVQTVKLLKDTEYVDVVNNKISKSLRVPGWGSAFAKGKPDTEFNIVDGMIKELDNNLYTKIESITNMLHELGKEVYPNAACYTAACGIILQISDEIVPYLLIRGRLDVWTGIYMYNKADVL